MQAQKQRHSCIKTQALTDTGTNIHIFTHTQTCVDKHKPHNTHKTTYTHIQLDTNTSQNMFTHTLEGTPIQ